MKELLKQYHLEPTEIKKLEGYGSINYRIKDKDNNHYVLKHYTDPSELALIQAESEIINAISGKLSFKIPVNSSGKQTSVHQYADKNFSRLLPYIKGPLLSKVKHSPGLLYNFGKSIAELDRSLERIRNTEIESRKFVWDLQYCLLNRSKIKYITDPSKTKLVEYYFDQFEHFVLPELPDLRYSIIHNDLNDYNIMTDGKKITGLIDFGDITYAPLVNEIAIALAYIMIGKENPFEAAYQVIRGYQTLYPLNEEELKLLYYLIPARLCTSVCNSAEFKVKGEDTEYISINEKPAWALLEKWISYNPVGVKNQFLKAAGYPLIDLKKKNDDILSIRKKNTGKSLGLSYSTPIYMTGAAFQYMYDHKGNTYLDARNNIPHVGHCHPKISQAISRQTRLLNTNTRYLYDSLAKYIENLLPWFPPKLNKIFFVNSGSAASDLAVRMAQTYTSRDHLLVLEHGYHGNTIIGIDISSYKFDGKGGKGMSPGVTRLPLPKLFNGKFRTGEEYAKNATEQISGLINNNILPAAFIAEPVSGCGGQVPLAPGYLKTIKPFLEKHQILTILDEVQTGFGRLGDYFWGFELHGIIPDLVILGKPMGNGHPVAAVVTTEEISNAFATGMEFFSSFGGNPVSCEAANAVLEVIEEEKLMQNAKETGDYFISSLNSLQKDFPAIGDIRGSGLFIGIEFINKDGKPDTKFAEMVNNRLKQHFILAGTDGPYENVLKIKPPLCFNKSNTDFFMEELNEILNNTPDRIRKLSELP
ncbi:MAG: aminotransferase class III-fold pyridoxal phosphate-dependent enzyme [Bacteroidetes bacterium]|nr:aminotransferase class III-fold pyridoxal phosphate-dependent enzyme [Bacteroidota bacterium]